MSAIGSATARGPEMWCDTLGVRRFLQQRREHGMLQRLLGCGVIEHALERGVDALGPADLLYGAAVVVRVAGSALLSARDEALDRLEVGQPVVALDVPEDRV